MEDEVISVLPPAAPEAAEWPFKSVAGGEHRGWEAAVGVFLFVK